MQKIIFQCETITPMFLAGADGKTPELRPPSIKAAMRFWWRAINGHLPLAELMEKEALIFGGSGEKEGRSKFSIRITCNSNDIFSEYRPLPHSDNKKFTAKCIKERVAFQVIISNADETIKNLFLTVSYLGGIGKRSRRGFGSFKVIKIGEESYSYEFNSLLTLLNKLHNDGFQLNETNKNEINCVYQKQANYPIIEKVIIGKEYNDINELLKKIGESSHKNDCYHTGFTEKYNGENLRFASPIYVSCLEIKNVFYPVITKLKSSSSVPFISLSNNSKKTNKVQDFIEEIII
ncbi:MAG: type III-B CRISPR module RAMP protein Cmr1 [Melioribacteraceae bacterium]|nr:type III-B CRISPR module RAMP protein Cmr1 [Melioribacteraceae bacterium]